jgi:hypothetical protein
MEYIPIINMILNILILPLLAVLWGIKVELARLNALLEGHGGRIERLEAVHDAMIRGS